MIGRDRDKDRQRQSQRERLRPKSEKPALMSQPASGFLRIGTEYRKEPPYLPTWSLSGFQKFDMRVFIDTRLWRRWLS
jgi:hypothetical protein